MPAGAQRSVEEHLLRLESIDTEEVTEADCEAEIARANQLSASDLIYAGVLCLVTESQVESSFLIAAGQIRALTDLSLMPPATSEDLSTQTALYGLIYYYAGGGGADELYRDPIQRDRMLDMIDAWRPVQTADYNPGWDVGTRPDSETYSVMLEQSRAYRRQQLVEYATLIEDDEYFVLHTEINELFAQNGQLIREGTASAERIAELNQQMSERSHELGIASNNFADDIAEDLNHPPSAPSQEEIIVIDYDDEVVRQCTERANRIATMSLSETVRILVTVGSEWGTVFRTDLIGPEEPPNESRFICSAQGSLFETGNSENRPPLPEQLSDRLHSAESRLD